MEVLYERQTYVVGVAVILVTTFGIYIAFRKKNKEKSVPTLNFFQVLYHLKDFNPYFVNFIKQHQNPKFVKFAFGFQTQYCATHPESIRHVLKHPEIFPKYNIVEENKVPESLKKQLGGNIVNADGDQWKKQRNVLNPSFHFDVLKNCVPIFVNNFNMMIQLWKKDIDQGNAIDVAPWMNRFTIQSLGTGLFDLDFQALKAEKSKYYEGYQAWHALLQNATKALRLFLPRWFPGARSIHQSMDAINSMVAEVIAEKKESNTTADLLGRILDKDNSFTDQERRANVLAMIIAGHETTASALGWILHLLSIHKDVQKKVIEEIANVTHGSEPNNEQLKQLTYTGQVIKESLRLYAPAAMQSSRKVADDVEYEGIVIPKGTIISIDFHVVHHLEEYWPEPEKFDPDRFSTANSVGRDPFCFVPFSMGPRACIGNNFAVLEMLAFLCCLFQRYQVEPTGPVTALPHFMLNIPKEVKLIIKPVTL